MTLQNLHSLTDLPSDVVQLVAKFLLPYDILELSKTCKTFVPILFERSVWLQVAETVSHSRPLPYTAGQALDLPIKDLILPCLRAQRVATRWAEPDIHPRSQPVKICFPDKRVVSYFTFLPGSRHLMVYDVRNIMSCWTTKGELLRTWQVAHGAKLTRWKPCDESENNYEYDRGMQAVEIMIEFPRRSRPTRCEIILLTYAGTMAHFAPVNSFRVPNAFEPFSAMTQDELRGSLVGIPSLGEERVGIYLTDRNTEKAVCIDTGLSLVLDCVPQALLSPKHMCLYWETHHGAHTVAYDMDGLRAVLARDGRAQDDPALNKPVPVAPSDTRVVPFETVRAADEYQAEEGHDEDAAYAKGEGPLSTDLSENRDAYPVIIPKWTTLREDLRRHRTRSVLTFSRRPAGEDVETYANVDPLDDGDVGDDGGDDGGAGANFEGDFNNNIGPMNAGAGMMFGQHAANAQEAAQLMQAYLAAHHVPWMDDAGGQPDALQLEIQHGIAPVVFPGLQADVFNNNMHHINFPPPPFPQPVMHQHNHNPHDHAHAHAHIHLQTPPHMPLPRTTITHHYFDYTGCIDEFGCPTLQPPMLRRTVIAEATLRRPRDVHLHVRRHMANGGGEEHIGAEDADDEDDGQVGIEGIEAFGEDEDEGDEDETEDEEAGNDEALAAQLEHIMHLENLIDGVHFIGGVGGVGGGGGGGGGGGVNPNVFGMPMGMGIEVLGVDDDEFVQDPFGGSPVMGYGGRCAMWVEERLKVPPRRSGCPRHPRLGTEAVLRVATFPTYRPPGARTELHKELEVARGRVGTLHLPPEIQLDNAYTFDLDDVRGVVGIATAYGEIWLVDFS